ncbi:TonB-dependent receptor [Acetobacter indonesiensis NRIC 0313]|uniref:TonB-dependent receptor n=1 Tax=Acetobacter indonesiensis TaxID=104101 RepID=A0A6N3TA23_9PROT|nr:TonB-dependent receptor [Acetobacter indonesiensis]GAN64408.1 TonB-dependent receptor [Acetobacter indonesiensis]GBQ55877.1 TonB-dependent receptor [Acetobacter indonesiensis NRIC 0313]GEN04579.1 TonB-dependent receptor [Acetobacter indonesiensis]
MSDRCAAICGQYSRSVLLFGTALTSLLLTPSLSVAATAHTHAHTKKQPLHTQSGKTAAVAPVRTASAAPARHRRSGPMHSKDSEEINVSTRRVASRGPEVAVTRKVMDRFVEGTNPMQILAQTTPGANFTSTDAFGLDTYGNTFYMRGFTQMQIGATLDGIPMGTQGFANYNGVSITQAMIQDDIGGMTMSQGAGALDSFSAQNLGGAMTYVSSDPKDKAGGKISQTFGSYNAFRTYGRVDSGVLNSTGTKFYASFARTKTNMWKGQGYQSELQADAKVVQPLGNRGKVTAFFGYGNFTQGNYLTMTKNMWKTMGRYSTYLKPDYEKAKLWAYYAQYTSDVPPGYEGLLSNDEIGDYAWDASQIQRTYLSSINTHYDLFKNVKSDTVIYGNVSSAVHGGTNNFVTSPTYGTPELQADGTVSGVPMALSMAHAFMRRLGGTQKFTIEAPHHNRIETGVWYENNHWIYNQRLYEDGLTSAHNWLSDFKQGTGHTWYNNSFNTNTFQFFLQDRWTIIPGMNLLAGFKSLTQTTHGGTKDDYTQQLTAEGWNTYYRHAANGTLTASAAFLPHFNFDYHFLDHHEFYWDIAENMRAYDYYSQTATSTAWGGLGNSSYTAQQVFNANKKVLKPERTWNYVVGYRYDTHLFSASADFYHTDYYNRLASITEGTANNANSAYLNVGRETMNGADVMGTIRPFEGLEITNSFSWNNAEYQSRSINYGGTNYNIKGKHQVYYPKFMYKANLNYTYKRAMFNFNVNYIGSRPMTYLNDQKIPSYWVANMNLAYNFGKIGFTQNLKATFGITNLFDSNYIGGVYGAASVQGDNNANLFVAAPRQFFGTVSAEF